VTTKKIDVEIYRSGLNFTTDKETVVVPVYFGLMGGVNTNGNGDSFCWKAAFLHLKYYSDTL
jgi:hypothetical protein